MDLGFSGLFTNWVTIPHKWPPPISQHLYAKCQMFSTQSPTIGTWGKQPPLISCHNHFLAWQLYSFPLSFNACNSLRASSPGHSGGRAGKGRRACTYVSGICFEKVDAKPWLAEMTLAMKSLPLAHVFQCLFTFALISASCWWWKFDSSFDGGPQGNWRWNSNSRGIIASSPSFTCLAARATLRANVPRLRL